MPSSTEHTTTQAQHGVYGTAAYDVAGAAQMSFAPINRIHQHLCGLHIYAHDPERAVEAHHFCTHLTPDMHQCVIYDSPGPKARLIDFALVHVRCEVEAHHFCTHLTPDMHQCVIYDSPGPKARLIGIEYVIAEKLFEGLPADEKKYWHSHKHEVESGMLKLGMKSLVPSMVDDMSERPAMLELHRTYGKTIHTWQYDKHPELPLGPPQLMMSLTDDSIIEKHKSTLEEMDQKVGVSSQAKRELRAGYLPKENMEKPVAEGADSGLEQRLQFELKPQES